MSKLHKSIHKSNKIESVNENSTGFQSISSTSNDDFLSILTSKLNNLNIQNSNINNSNLESRSGSIKSPLSRQESRQNSILSFIIDPDINIDDDSKNINDKVSNASESRENSLINNKLKLKIYTIPDLIKVLNMSSRELTRNKIGSIEIEILVSHLYRMIISINNEIYLGEIGGNDEDFTNLFHLKNSNYFNFNSNSFNWEVWIRCITSYGCIEVDEVASEVVELVFPMLLKLINEIEEIGNIENNDLINFKKIDLSIWSFMSLVLFIFYDSENYGILEHAKLFLHYLQNNSLNDEKIIESCILMIGISLTLAWESNRDFKDFIEFELLEVLRLILINKKRKYCKSSVAALIGLCFELLQNDEEDQDGDDDDEEEDNEFLNDEFRSIASEIETLANEGSKKLGKRGKTAKNIFRQVLNNLNKTEDEENEELDFIVISKSKNINIKTWFTYFRVQIVRFVYGNELNSWLANSKELRNMLKKRIRNNKFSNKLINENISDDDDDNNKDVFDYKANNSSSYNGKSKREIEKERTKQLNKERLLKENPT